MNYEIEQLLRRQGASLIGFGRIEGLYSKGNHEKDQKSMINPFEFVHHPIGISIALAYPREIIKNIKEAPTMEYYDAYHQLNQKLDDLANLCADYIKERGYHAYPQTTKSIKQYGEYRTIMPHKTVAVKAGLGWIGKSALFITEPYGSALRLTSVLTNAPLITNEVNLQSKCKNCKVCVKACPANAISGRSFREDLDRDEFYNAKACYKAAREISAKSLNKEITLCGKCIEVCPYTKRYLGNIEAKG